MLGSQGDDQSRDVQLLRALTHLTVPSIEEVSEASAALRRAIAAQAELAGSTAEHNASLARAARAAA